MEVSNRLFNSWPFWHYFTLRTIRESGAGNMVYDIEQDNIIPLSIASRTMEEDDNFFVNEEYMIFGSYDGVLSVMTSLSEGSTIVVPDEVRSNIVSHLRQDAVLKLMFPNETASPVLSVVSNASPLIKIRKDDFAFVRGNYKSSYLVNTAIRIDEDGEPCILKTLNNVTAVSDNDEVIRLASNTFSVEYLNDFASKVKESLDEAELAKYNEASERGKRLEARVMPYQAASGSIAAQMQPKINVNNEALASRFLRKPQTLSKAPFIAQNAAPLVSSPSKGRTTTTTTTVTTVPGSDTPPPNRVRVLEEDDSE
jgi:hypothetical protein